MTSFDMEDDHNLELPNYFITCFNTDQLMIYAEAIQRYKIIDPLVDLEIDQSGKWNRSHDPALLLWNRPNAGNLSPFWHVLREIERNTKSTP